MERFIWDCVDVHERLSDDRSAIVGYTPTLFSQEAYPYAIWADIGDVKTARIMDIDCGCVANDIHGRLGATCLDTRIIQYF